MTSCKINQHIQNYINLVRSGNIEVCEEQLKLCDHVEKVFSEEELYTDDEQLEKYLSYQKYFPYKLFEWEEFCFALHNCVYRSDGHLRWPVLFMMVGRGTGKNGFLSFENFALLTPTNGVKEYHIDIFAMSEDQAMQSWLDVYNILEDNKAKMQKYFYWNKKIIINKQTKSEFRYRTSNYKSKDGGRQGKIDFDEYHAYSDYKLIDVATTGLGKKAHPRRTIITTDGEVREGPLDEMLILCEEILNEERPDNGILPFICKVESEDEVKDPKKWEKAIPSLRYLPNLKYEIEIEFTNYLINPIANRSFALKRMNFRPPNTEGEVTSWENILATNQPIDKDKLIGMSCIAGIDYMKTTDFLSAGLLFNVDDKDIWIEHTWVCKKSPDLPRIKADLNMWEAMGLLTFVDGPEIPPELPCYWLANTAAALNAQIVVVGIDFFRYTLLSKALKEILYMSDEKGYENIIVIRPSDEMKNIPIITSDFVNHRIIAGDDPLFRWAINNSKQTTSPAGNITYGKIESKSRKTDPFKAYVAAKCASYRRLENNNNITSIETIEVYSF